jgi:hypothetical protein
MRQLVADKLVGGRVPAVSTHWRARAIPSSHLVHRFGADIAEKIRQKDAQKHLAVIGTHILMASQDTVLSVPAGSY